MAGNPTTVGAQALVDFLTGRAVAWEERDVYLALCTSLPPDNVSLSSLPEVTTPGYARQKVTWGAASPSRPSVASNSAVVTFGPMTDDMSVPVTHAALVTAQTGTTGDVLFIWSLDTTQQAVNGQALQIAIGKLTISLS